MYQVVLGCSLHTWLLPVRTQKSMASAEPEPVVWWDGLFLAPLRGSCNPTTPGDVCQSHQSI